MRNEKVILMLRVALILAAGGIATASNMAFKFVKSYTRVSASQNDNSLSLPYFQSQFTKANDVIADNPAIVRVCKFGPPDTGFSFPAAKTCWFSAANSASPSNFTITNENGLSSK